MLTDSRHGVLGPTEGQKRALAAMRKEASSSPIELSPGVALAAPDPAARARAAMDIVRRPRIDPDDASLWSLALAAARIGETDPVAATAQVEALAVLAERHRLPPAVFECLAAIQRGSVTPDQADDLAFLDQCRPDPEVS
ncbi:hypothetical protein [Nocardioides caldifontis]|uniref:hypothetical protein n=1 Tax=Nocardioides caldifontis TaxID=2588938 RepID=UPI0011DF83E6|nr:hypothetical protein [Nocardioides caldifontis]